MDLRILGVTLPLLAVATAVSLKRKSLGEDWTALLGLVFTLVGDFFLAMRSAPPNSTEFIYGVAGFGMAQLCWIAHFARHRTVPLWEMLLGLLLTFMPYLHCRVLPHAVGPVGNSMMVYAVLSCLSLSMAMSSRNIFWCLGISFLFVSDLCISASVFVGAPYYGHFIAPLYILSLLAVTLAILFPKLSFPPPYQTERGHKVMLWLSFGLYGIALASFLLAMFHTPSGNYNPLRQMLSYLGRVLVDGVKYPPCHYLFLAGMTFSALAIAVATPHYASLAPRRWMGRVAKFAGAINAAGLMSIALVPEDVNGLWHVNCCFVATFGGIGLIAMVWAHRWDWILVGLAGLAGIVFQVCLHLHSQGRIPFSPAVPTMQKTVIVSFMLWGFCHLVRGLWKPR